MNENANGNKHLDWVGADGTTYHVRQLRIDELDSVYALNRAQLQAEVAPIEFAKAALEHNPDTFWGVYRKAVDEQPEALAGYLAFLMLNEDGAARVKRGAFDAFHPDVAYLAAGGERPFLIYVWAVVARGLAAIAVPTTVHAMGSLYADLPLCGRAATKAGADAMRRFGYKPLNPDAPDVGNLFWLDRATAYQPKPTPALESRFKVIVAHGTLEMEHAFAIRAGVFMVEQNCPFAEEFDGNDHTATHIVGYMDGEPAAALRIRYYADFVKIERLAVLPRFRGSLVGRETVAYALEFCRRKGYRRMYGHAQKRLLKFWGQFGFEPIAGAAPFVFSDHDYIEVAGELAPHPNPLTIGASPYVFVRPEGAWDTPGILETSAKRGATNPH